MKKIFDWLKDFVYDSIDYIIMLVIIVSVVFVIGWRLDVLFANDAADIPPKNIVSEEENPNIEDEPIKEDLPENEPTDNVESAPDDVVPESPIAENPVVETPTVTPSAKTVNITIPPGSLPSKIGSILEANGVIGSKNDFVNKAQELKLDTKLKSGSFEIQNNASIEEILKIITK